MFKRKIYEKMLAWKESLSIKRKALIIKGLRQIGKTTIVLDFCEKNYQNIVYINFKNDETLKSAFNGDLNVDKIIFNLSFNMPNIKFIPYKTVIIFDELQECANARASIKCFMEDKQKRFDIIGTGSLLGLRGYNKKKSKGIPTGFETIITMKPMDFEEFLWAKGLEDSQISYLKNCFINNIKIDESINTTMHTYFKEYLCVGGMPEVIDTFLKTNNMNNVLEIQKQLLEEYKDDFGKHLNEEENEEIDLIELARIMEVYNSIPNQLAKENKKFQYSNISKHSKAREYRFAIEWLQEFGLVTLCYNLDNLELPLEGNKDSDCFKVYVQDTGLFVAMLEEGSASKIFNNEFDIYKGAIFENVIADAFAKNNRNLYYYHKNSGLEIDFVTKFNSELTLIEVKSTNNKSKSLSTILNNFSKYHIKNNIKLTNGNIGNDSIIYSYPYYIAFLINSY